MQLIYALALSSLFDLLQDLRRAQRESACARVRLARVLGEILAWIQAPEAQSAMSLPLFAAILKEVQGGLEDVGDCQELPRSRHQAFLDWLTRYGSGQASGVPDPPSRGPPPPHPGP